MIEIGKDSVFPKFGDWRIIGDGVQEFRFEV